MKIINLPRQLVYTDRRTLDDFLRSDELSRELYKVYLRVKDNPYYFKFSAEKAFNEAYYIATMAMNESHPELDVREWWFAAKRYTHGVWNDVYLEHCGNLRDILQTFQERLVALG